jgi:CBS domain containing-hemolysin-like protein
VFIPGFTESFKKTIQDLRANKDREMEEEQQLEHQLERAEHAMIHGQFSFDKKKK